MLLKLQFLIQKSKVRFLIIWFLLKYTHYLQYTVHYQHCQNYLPMFIAVQKQICPQKTHIVNADSYVYVYSFVVIM
jgi:hypothetical protein